MDRLAPAELEAIAAAAEKRPTWPAVGIVSVIKKQFHSAVDYLGEVDDFSVYGVHDNGLNFVVALYHLPRKKALVTEIALLASFVDYHFPKAIIDKINPKLHLGAAVIEGEDLYLAAKIEPKGRFRSGSFSVMMDTWRHDLMVTLKVVNECHANRAGKPITSARATPLVVETPGGLPGVLRASLAKACVPCRGSGRTRLLKRECGACGGGGIAARGH